MAFHRRSTIRARALRKAMTPHEARLWIYLRALRAKGFRFRRQVPLKGYYVDFVCFRSRLVIEADGGHHTEDAQANLDAVRDAVLTRAGFRVLRFDNDVIRYEPDGVDQAICRALQIDHLEGPLKELGEG
jgi:very-short-patch-repair endonuclease